MKRKSTYRTILRRRATDPVVERVNKYVYSEQLARYITTTEKQTRPGRPIHMAGDKSTPTDMLVTRRGLLVLPESKGQLPTNCGSERFIIATRPLREAIEDGAINPREPMPFKDKGSIKGLNLVQGTHEPAVRLYAESLYKTGDSLSSIERLDFGGGRFAYVVGRVKNDAAFDRLADPHFSVPADLCPRWARSWEYTVRTNDEHGGEGLVIGYPRNARIPAGISDHAVGKMVMSVVKEHANERTRWAFISCPYTTSLYRIMAEQLRKVGNLLPKELGHGCTQVVFQRGTNPVHQHHAICGLWLVFKRGVK